MHSTSLYDYTLPQELIAQYPAEPREAARMLVVHRESGDCELTVFGEIGRYLRPSDVMIFNDTRVLRGRMFGRKNGESAGARFELLLVMPRDPSLRRWQAMLKPGKRARPGTSVTLLDRGGNPCGETFSILTRNDDGTFDLEFSGNDFEHLQASCGHVPLPPYIRRPDDAADAEHYQTVFAAAPGAVAAPTAGLHFTPDLLDSLTARGIRRAALTLHVGPGTFLPVSTEDLTRHRMHAEAYSLGMETAALVNTARAAGDRVLAVGTTTVRVLESCVDEHGIVHPQSGETRIFLYPPYVPRATDMLLTNFHLPQSTLLMLVSTFSSREKILRAYELAIRERFRFYSYGDCMLLL